MQGKLTVLMSVIRLTVSQLSTSARHFLILSVKCPSKTSPTVIKINAKSITPHLNKVEEEFNETTFALTLLHSALC